MRFQIILLFCLGLFTLSVFNCKDTETINSIKGMDSVLTKELREELLRMEESDQFSRNKVDSIIRHFGIHSPQFDNLKATGKKIDSLNTLRLIEIVKEYGWPGKSLVGYDGSHSAWLILQHSDTTTQGKFLHLLEDGVKTGEVTEIEYAYLLDRVLTNRNLPQYYGTQFKYIEETKTYEIFPIDDEKNVIERRNRIGLDNIEVNISKMNSK